MRATPHGELMKGLSIINLITAGNMTTLLVFGTTVILSEYFLKSKYGNIIITKIVTYGLSVLSLIYTTFVLVNYEKYHIVYVSMIAFQFSIYLSGVILRKWRYNRIFSVLIYFLISIIIYLLASQYI